MAPTKTPNLFFLGQNEDHGRKLENSFYFLYVVVVDLSVVISLYAHIKERNSTLFFMFLSVL